MKSRALVFSGGGLKGAFQLGALSTIMAESVFNPSVISGISTGALSASVLAQAIYESPIDLRKKYSTLLSLYNNLEGPMGRVRFPGGYAGIARGLIFNGSIEHPVLLEKLISRHLDVKKLKTSRREFRCGSVNLNTGKYVPVTQNTKDLDKHVLASATIPVVWPPVLIDGAPHVDGGARNMFPLRDTIHALRYRTPIDYPLHMTLLLASPIHTQEQKIDHTSAHSIISRSVGILINQILVNDLRELLYRNDLAEAGDVRYRHIDVRVVYPSEHYDVGLVANQKDISRMYRDGVNRAKHYVGNDQLKELLDGDNYV